MTSIIVIMGLPWLSSLTVSWRVGVADGKMITVSPMFAEFSL